MEERCTGGDMIVRILIAAGVECIFGIISIHNIPIYDAIARQGGIRSITNRSEPGAVALTAPTGVVSVEIPIDLQKIVRQPCQKT
jgi:glyoxylate carboligase